jgi:hypothetical protein
LVVRKVVLVLLSVASISSLAETPRVPPSFLRSDAPALEISTSIEPITADEYQLLHQRAVPGSYRCSALIHDEPGSNRVWGAKDIVIGPGESGETSSTFGQLGVTFRAEIAKTLDRAKTIVTVTRDGKIINRQSTTVWLQRPAGTRRLQ